MPAEDPRKWMLASAAVWECSPDLLCRWSPSFHKVRPCCFFELYFKLSSSGKLPLPCARPDESVVSHTTSAQTEPRKTAGLHPSQGCTGYRGKVPLVFGQEESSLLSLLPLVPTARNSWLCSAAWASPAAQAAQGLNRMGVLCMFLPPSRYPGFLAPHTFPLHPCLCSCFSWMTLSFMTQIISRH